MLPKQDYYPTINKNTKFRYQILIYTALYIVVAIGVFFTLIYFSRTFLRDGDGNIDGIAQLYPAYFRLKEIIAGAIAGDDIDLWGWYLGLGDDVFMTFQGKIFNPLTYIVLLFPKEYLDIGYDIMVYISQYLAGLMFMLFGRSMGFNYKQNIVGAISYAFCGWIIVTMVRQGPFLIAVILLPLILLGVEKILRKQSPALFIIVVAAHLYCSVLWSYVAAIVVILYYVLRYFYYHSKEKLIVFLKDVLVFFGYGIIGIMIACLSLVQNFIKLGGATTESTIEQSALYSLKDYLTIPAGFFELSEIHTLYSFITVPAIIVMLLPIIVINLKKKNTSAIMGVGLFILGLIPVTGSVFNGLSYTVGRWYYVIAFFLIWSAMEVFTRETFSKRKNIITMLIWIIGLATWNIGICYAWLEIISINTVLATLVGTICGIVTILCGWLYCRKDEMNIKSGVIFKRAVAVLTVMCLGASIVGYSNIMLFPWLSDFIYKLSPEGKIVEKYDSSSENATVVLQEEDGAFFRTDQVDGYSDTRIARVKANENVYFENRTIYTYFSTMKSSWHEFNKAMGNNAGYFDRTTSYSNDNRAALDFLMGVKYFLGNSNTKKPGASEYAPYGFEYHKTVEGVDVLKSKYNIGLGTTYDKYITESELMEYSYLEREQIIMQAAVVPDDYKDEISGVMHADKSLLKTDIREIPYTIANESNVSFNGGNMTIYNNDGSFDIMIPEVKNCQIVVSFDDLLREKCDYETALKLSGININDLDGNDAANYINDVSYEDDEKFKITVQKGNVVKAASNRKGKNQGFSDITDYNINVGYYESINGAINISFDRSGHYNYSDLTVYAVPMTIYEENAKKLEAGSLSIDSFDDDRIIGSFNAHEDSVLYLSILNTPGWGIYVDGEKVEKINDVNISFTGAKVDSGHHDICLEYKSPYMIEGMAISIAGILILIIVMVCFQRKRKGELKQNDENSH